MRQAAVVVVLGAMWLSGCGVSQTCLSWRDCADTMACLDYQCVPRARDDGSGGQASHGYQGSLGGIAGAVPTAGPRERWDTGGDVLYGRIGPMLFDPPLSPTLITRIPHPVGEEVQINFNEARANGFIRFGMPTTTLDTVSQEPSGADADTIACYMPSSGTYVDTPTPSSVVTALPDGRIDVRATDGTWAGRFRPPHVEAPPLQ